MSATDISAIVQADSAVVIVFLTGALAWTAWNALKASREQAKSASDAIAEMQRQRAEMRRQTALGALPVLHVKPPWPDVDLERLPTTYVELTNTGTVPVLGLQLEIRTENQAREPGTQTFARHELSMVVPDLTTQFGVDSRDLFNMDLDWDAAQALQARGERPPFYHSDSLLFDFSYRTPLGAEVRQRYRWRPNTQPAADEAVWMLDAVWILPDHANEQDVIHVRLG